MNIIQNLVKKFKKDKKNIAVLGIYLPDTKNSKNKKLNIFLIFKKKHTKCIKIMDLANKCLLSIAIVFIVFQCGTIKVTGVFTDDTF